MPGSNFYKITWVALRAPVPYPKASERLKDGACPLDGAGARMAMSHDEVNPDGNPHLIRLE